MITCKMALPGDRIMTSRYGECVVQSVTFDGGQVVVLDILDRAWPISRSVVGWWTVSRDV
jgi:hypothetical protein